MEYSDHAYLIHSKKYTDSRILVSVLTEKFGKLSAVMRLPRRKKSGHSMPQPFSKVALTWHGNKSLKTINLWEDLSSNYSLASVRLFCAIYINELIYRLLLDGDTTIVIFSAYESLLQDLSNHAISSEEIELKLRLFEFNFIEQLGYGISFESDCYGDAITYNATCFYEYSLEQGFAPAIANTRNKRLFSGQEVAAIAQLDINSKMSLSCAKKLTRMAIDELMDGKPLRSRELFL